MNAQQRGLIAVYALIALVALIITWGQNLAYFSDAPSDLFGPFLRFAEETKANPASRSITVDIGFFLLAASIFMVIEARRLGVGFVWLYILGGFLVAISVAFPLFMIARELRVGKASSGEWRLVGSDMIGLALVAAAIVGLSWFVLN